MKPLAVLLILFSSAAMADALDDQMVICRQHQRATFKERHMTLSYQPGFELCTGIEDQIRERNKDGTSAKDAADLDKLRNAQPQ